MRYRLLLLFGIMAEQNSQTASSAAHLPPAKAAMPAPRPTPTHNLLRRSDYPDSPTHTLLIFHDDSEEKSEHLHTISRQLLTTLYQRAAPILVSASLLYNIFNVPQGSFDLNLFNIQLKRIEISSASCNKDILLDASIEPSFRHFGAIERFTQLFIINDFTPEDWYIAEFKPRNATDPAFFLLVPKAYIKQHRALPTQPFSNLNALALADLCGLCLNSTTAQDSITPCTMTLLEWRLYFGSFGSPRVKIFSTAPLAWALSTCIISQKEYREKFKKHPPQWIIYLSGHGNSGTSIAQLTLSEFSQLLDFLNNTIVTQLLIYSSCFSAGENIKTVYKSRTSQEALGIAKIGTSYSFPIISIGIVEAELYSTFAITFSPAHRLKFTVNFNSFTQEAEAGNAPTYTSLLHHIIPHIEAFISQESNTSLIDIGASQLPLLRPAHLPYFIPLIRTIELTDLFVATHSSLTKPFNLIKYIKDNLKLLPQQSSYVLLSAQYIPFTIDFSDPSTPLDSGPLLLPKMLSTVHHDLGIHLFEKFIIRNPEDSAPYFGLDKIFISSFHYAKTKTFIIRNLTVLSDDQKETEYKNLVVEVDKRSSESSSPTSCMYRTDANGSAYKAILPARWKLLQKRFKGYIDSYSPLIKWAEHSYKILFAETQALAHLQNAKSRIKEQSKKASDQGASLANLHDQLALLTSLEPR